MVAVQAANQVGLKAHTKIAMKLPLATLLIGFLAQGCDPPAVQYPPGSTQSSSAIPSSQQAQMDKQRRWANAIDSAQKAATIGGLFGGPFGGPASMGMGVLGFLYGMITADSRIAEENAQAQARYQKEADKDRVLETAIEQELARQRGLENQIASANGQPSSAEPAVVAIPVSQPAPAPVQGPAQAAKPEPTVVARVSNPAPPPALQNPFRNVEVKDTNGDGIPDLWIYYNPQKPGEIVRQEEATKGDGRVDSWSYFRNGQLVRRDIDNKGLGQPDTIFYYEQDMLVREERDENGQGRMTYRASYQNGRLTKVEKDTTGQGRADLWIYYDATKDGEVVVKEERDLNGDGMPDLWSFFDNGRLVRRDVSAIGLDILSKQDHIPLPPSESLAASLPGS